MNAKFFEVFKAINHADLTPGVKINAYLLLERAPDGIAQIGWEEATQITELQSAGAIRKVFGALKKADIIEYHAGAQIWYTFFGEAK